MFLIFSLGDSENEYYFKYEEWTDVNCPMHCNDTAEIVIVLGGELLVKKENITYTLGKNEMILIMPFERHEFITSNHSEMVVLEANSGIFPDFSSELKNKTLKNPCCTLTESEKSFVWEHLGRINENFLIEVRCIFYYLFGIFIKDNEFIEFNTPDNLFKEVIIYTRDHFEENIMLKDVAAALGVSHVYLSRMFSKKFGTKFNEFLNSFRVRKAIQLLVGSSLTMSEICYSCGWGSIRNFNNCIQKALNCTPTEFRKKAGTDNKWDILVNKSDERRKILN